jgi:ribosomal protein L28
MTDLLQAMPMAVYARGVFRLSNTHAQSYLPINICASKSHCKTKRVWRPLLSSHSLAGSSEGSKYQNSAKTEQIPSISPHIKSDQPLVHYGQIILEANFKNNPETD